MSDEERMFAAEARFARTDRAIDMGRLHLPSGQLYCCDPFLSDEVAPLIRTVPRGDYSVSLDLLDSEDWGERVGFARLLLSDETVVTWEQALYRVGSRVSADFRVDAGFACFMDAQTEAAFRGAVGEFYRLTPQGNYYDDILAGGFRESARIPGVAGDWLMHVPSPRHLGNVAMFASGLGDGAYKAYWGVGKSGDPCRLIVDFGLG
jgi:hypothetical protein